MTYKEMVELDKKNQMKPFALDEPIDPIIVDHGISLILCCRRCKKELKDHTGICQSCGQAIKWA